MAYEELRGLSLEAVVEPNHDLITVTLECLKLALETDNKPLLEELLQTLHFLNNPRMVVKKPN